MKGCSKSIQTDGTTSMDLLTIDIFTDGSVVQCKDLIFFYFVFVSFAVQMGVQRVGFINCNKRIDSQITVTGWFRWDFSHVLQPIYSSTANASNSWCQLPGKSE